MKKFIVIILLAAYFMSFAGLRAYASETVLTVKPNIYLSDKADDPAVIDSTESVTLEFNEPVDMKTVSGEVKLYNIRSAGEAVEEPSITVIRESAPARLKIFRKGGIKFVEGEEYKIAVSGKVRSASGHTQAKDFAGYFAINYSFSLDASGIRDMNGERSQIICISDIHLGADPAYSECDRAGKGNGSALTDFLNKVRLAPNVSELVIAGDLIDEWFVPSNVDTFKGKTQADFVKRVAESHKTVIDAFNGIIKDGRIKLTYVPGNHDILITGSDIESILPGISQARDVKGLGIYSPAGHSEIAFEHGHRYNYFCAPDPISNRSITKTDSILPPGYFFTRIATSSVVERAQGVKVSTITPPAITTGSRSESQMLLYYYYKAFSEVLTALPVAEGFNDKFIKTNIDGFTADYAMSDVFPYQNAAGAIDVNLFKGAQDTWDQRQKANLVPVNIPVKEAILNAAYSSDLDEKSDSQYFKNSASDKRIVVFGHSHVPLIKASANTRSQKTIYANSGTWIDHNPAGPTMDFVVITPRKASGSAAEFVSLYSYSKEGTITRLPNPQAITDLN